MVLHDPSRLLLGVGRRDQGLPALGAVQVARVPDDVTRPRRLLARFESPDTLVVGDERLRAPRIYINVGGRAIVPDLPALIA